MSTFSSRTAAFAKAGVLVLIATVWHSAAKPITVDFINNADFSVADPNGKAVGWDVGQTDGTFQVNVDKAISHDNNGALRIDVIGFDTVSSLDVSQNIKNLAQWRGSTVAVSAWVKADGINPGGLQLVLHAGKRGANGSWQHISWTVVGRTPNGSSDWVLVQDTCTISQAAVFLVFRIIMNEPQPPGGQAWVDDITIDEVASHTISPFCRVVYRETGLKKAFAYSLSGRILMATAYYFNRASISPSRKTFPVFLPVH